MTDVKNLEEQGISSQSLYRGVIIDVYRDTVRLPDGKEAFRELIRHNGAVCVVPITDAGEVLCVRQYRYPFGRVTVEIPAGKLDSPDEDHREAALRELREETGASCEELVFIGDLYPSPAILDEVIHMYYARGLTMGETDPDDDEFIEIVKVPLSDLVDMVLEGRIPDGKTQAAILRASTMIERRRK